jgi:hypothetical protein
LRAVSGRFLPTFAAIIEGKLADDAAATASEDDISEFVPSDSERSSSDEGPSAAVEPEAKAPPASPQDGWSDVFSIESASTQASHSSVTEDFDDSTPLKGAPISFREYATRFFRKEQQHDGGYRICPLPEAYYLSSSCEDIHVSTWLTAQEAIKDKTLKVKPTFDVDSLVFTTTRPLLAHTALGNAKWKLYLQTPAGQTMSARTSAKVIHEGKVTSMASFASFKIGVMETTLGNFDMWAAYADSPVLAEKAGEFYAAVKKAVISSDESHPETKSMVCDASYGTFSASPEAIYVPSKLLQQETFYLFCFVSRLCPSLFAYI